MARDCGFGGVNVEAPEDGTVTVPGDHQPVEPVAGVSPAVGSWAHDSQKSREGLARGPTNVSCRQGREGFCRPSLQGRNDLEGPDLHQIGFVGQFGVSSAGRLSALLQIFGLVLCL